MNAQDLETRLQRNDRIDCSVYAENSSALIGSYQIEQFDSVLAVLDIWERECGRSEPVLRLRMLHDIYFGRFQSEDYLDYYKLYIRKYMYRMEVAERSTAKSNYESNKSYYDHTVIGNGFDKHTSALATQLLNAQIQGSDAHLMCLLFSNDFDAFYNTSQYQSSVKTPLIKTLFYSPRRLFSNIKLFGGLGLWIPLGNNKEVFNTSPMITIGAYQPISPRWRMEAFFTLTPFVNNEPLNFKFEGRDNSTSSLLALNMSGGLTRTNRISDKWSLDTGISMGINILGTDIERSSDEESDHSIATFDSGFRLGLSFRTKKDKLVSLQASMHAAPYNLSGNLRSEVGERYVSVGLAFGI